MARQIGSGRRVSVSARAATIIGIVCVAALAFAVPALADDNDGPSVGARTSHSADADRSSDRSDERSDAVTDDDPPGAADPDDNGPDDSAADDSAADANGPDDRADGTASARGASDRNGRGKDKDNGKKAANPNLVDGTPCTKTARACVDLKSQEAWLISPAGAVTRGPVKVSSGGPGEETPVGTFAVQWKDKNHKSAQYKEPNGQPAPMPYSVFFANGGVAFHGGSLSRASAGCVHLDDADAIVFYNTLKLGDQVQVH